MSAASGTHVEITDAADVAVGESAAAATAFEPVAAAKDPWTTSSELKDYRTKWGLSGMRCATLRFDAKFEPTAATAFLLDLFNSAAARAATGAPLPDGCRVTRVHAEQLRTTVTSTDFFDRLADVGIVSGDSGCVLGRVVCAIVPHQHLRPRNRSFLHGTCLWWRAMAVQVPPAAAGGRGGGCDGGR